MKQWVQQHPKSVLVIGFVILIAIGLISYNLYIYFVPGNVSDYNSCMRKRDSQQVCPFVPPCECTYNGKTYYQDKGSNLDLPENEKSQIEAWLEENNYNQYGDKVDTIYAGGSPLFNESTGKSILLYDYLVQKYPNKPWLKKTANSNNNSEVKSFTEVKTWKNFENPNFELQYPDFANMSDKNTYPIKFTADNDFEFIIEVSDKQPNYSAGTCEKKLDIDDKSLYLCYNKTITYQEIYQRMLDSFVIR
jgi:hypothetical protein